MPVEDSRPSAAASARMVEAMIAAKQMNKVSAAPIRKPFCKPIPSRNRSRLKM